MCLKTIFCLIGVLKLWIMKRAGFMDVLMVMTRYILMQRKELFLMLVYFGLSVLPIEY